MALVTPVTGPCVALAALDDALVWLAGHDAAAVAGRLRALGRFDRDGLVSARVVRAVLEDAESAELAAIRALPAAFAGAESRALRDGAGAVLEHRAGAD